MPRRSQIAKWSACSWCSAATLWCCRASKSPIRTVSPRPSPPAPSFRPATPPKPSTWLTRAARVREGAGRLLETTRYIEAIDGVSPTLTVAQLPFTAGERWVGLPPLPGKELLPGSRLAGGVWTTPDDLKLSPGGLVIDEWNEVVPSARETTGVVFNYDEPDARAPHAILLAVTPDASKPWDLDTLEAVLLETLELAKLRLVDQDSMHELDHYLPALYFGLNATSDAVATHF